MKRGCLVMHEGVTEAGRLVYHDILVDTAEMA